MKTISLILVTLFCSLPLAGAETPEIPRLLKCALECSLTFTGHDQDGKEFKQIAKVDEEKRIVTLERMGAIELVQVFSIDGIQDFSDLPALNASYKAPLYPSFVDGLPIKIAFGVEGTKNSSKVVSEMILWFSKDSPSSPSLLYETVKLLQTLRSSKPSYLEQLSSQALESFVKGLAEQAGRNAAQ